VSNIEFVVLDVYDFTRADTFDAAYCRNLLQHLSRAVDVLRAMWASVRAGGVIVVEDADFDGSFCYPPDEGFDFWVAGYQQAPGEAAFDVVDGVVAGHSGSPRAVGPFDQSPPGAPTATEHEPVGAG